MNNWAARRKSVYLATTAIILASAAFLTFWKFWYVAPTCSNGARDGDEVGVDCGGSCPVICGESVSQPITRWDPRLFEVASGTWSVLVYVENPNINTDALYAPYTFTIYGDGNNILAKREGATILPKNRTVGVFEGNIILDSRPRRALFELSRNIVWVKNDLPPPEIRIEHTPLLRLSNAPRVEAIVSNDSLEDLENIELVAAVFDGSDNVIAASRTFIEDLPKNEDAEIFFTWPKPFSLGSKVCEQPSEVMLLLDRSGSMAALGSNPPEPLTQAKAAARLFVEELGVGDEVGVVSFATEASSPIEMAPTSDFGEVIEAIGNIGITEGATQYTNIFEAIKAAWQALEIRESPNVSEIMILLTDGVATYPKDPDGSSEADDIKYAEEAALKQAEEAKNQGVAVYTIGLGKEVNQSFLEKMASKKENYYFAPSAFDLKSIYKDISSRICQEVPARIEITYKIFGDAI